MSTAAISQTCEDQRNAGLQDYGNRYLAGYDLVDAGAVQDDGDWCAATGLRFESRGTLALAIDGVRWRLDNDLDGPISLSLILDGARIFATGADPWTNHLLDLQSKRMRHTGELFFQQTPETGEVGFSLRLGSKGGYEASIVVDMIDPQGEVMRGNVPLGGAIRYVSLAIANEGFLDGIIYSFFAGRLSQDPGQPADLIARAKQDASDLVNELPRETVNSLSKFALQDFVRALPAPYGSLTLSMRAQDPVPVARILTLGVAGVWSDEQLLIDAFGGNRVEILYDSFFEGHP